MQFPLFGNGLLPSLDTWSGPTSSDSTHPDAFPAVAACPELDEAKSAEAGRSLGGELGETRFNNTVCSSDSIRPYRTPESTRSLAREFPYKVQDEQGSQRPYSIGASQTESAQRQERVTNKSPAEFIGDLKWVSPLSLSVPKIIDVKDEKYFHNYLTKAYPRMPYGAGTIWTSVLPAYALEYDYLMYAMLALGASELDYRSSGTCSQHGVEYRAKAISSLKDATNLPTISQEVADARIATSLLLVVQATYMDDGVEDFLVTLNTLATHTLRIGAQSIFAPFQDQLKVPTMPVLADTGRPLSSKAAMLVAEASNSIAEIQDLISEELPLKWWRPLIIGIDNFVVNPSRSYFGFTSHYNNFKDSTLEHMSDLFTYENEVAWLQISHWLALHILCQQCEPPESPYRELWFQRPVIDSWIRQIDARISVALRHHTIWPERMASMPDTRAVE